MSSNVFLLDSCLFAIIIGIGYLCLLCLPQKAEKEKCAEWNMSGSYHNDDSSYYHQKLRGYPRNNHDDQKYKHTTRESAEREKDRMQRQGVPGSQRLNVYYNQELDGWFVGRSSWKRNY